MLAITSTTASIWTAVGTLTLAIVTGISLVFGWKSLRQGQREVEEAHRPVVVPVLLTRPSVDRSVSSRSGRGPRPAYEPEVSGPDGLRFPVQNIGSGPALRVEARTRRLGPGAPGGRQTPAMAAGIGVTEIVPLEVKFPREGELPDFDLTVTYEDVAGKKWSTVGRYIADNRQYLGVEISALDEG
jgi:hypothetical protein